MAAFEYVALDFKGRSKKGVIDGDSARQIRGLLKSQGLHPMQIDKIEHASNDREWSISQRGISTARLALITRQLATMIRAGIPLEESLRALGEQVGKSSLQSVIAGVRAQVMDGMPLHAALGYYPRVFPELYRVMVEAGETSGRLEEVLDRLATYTEERQQLRQKLSVALIYPCLVTTVAVLVVIALLTYVVPEVVRVFEQTGQALPLLTVYLIATSDILRSYGLHFLILLSAGIVGFKLLLRQQAILGYWHKLLLGLPLIGKINRSLSTARLSRTLFILTESGVPLLDALRICTRMIKNLPIRKALEDASTAVREGGRLYVVLAQTNYFPPIFLHMLAAGEESGELEEMLERSAIHQEQELENVTSTATSLLEPVLILLMGVMVLVIVLAILLPIFEMNRLV